VAEPEPKVCCRCVTSSCWGPRHTHEREKDRQREWEKKIKKERQGDPLQTVSAPESPMMPTFDKKNLGKRPPPISSYSLENPRQTGMCWQCGSHILRRQPWILFFGFQEHEREGYDHKLRRKKQFTSETLKIQKRWGYHETMLYDMIYICTYIHI
jgi:hypothetical protein